ncbi:MAG TPA: acyl-CoA dehydrogenase [Desulfomonilaceae bacterium]|nr:acyl-CoA dehydrogenase [Desulfomonilaceae bacterium]
MANLLVDERDLKFVLYEQLNIEELCASEPFTEFSREMFDMVLDAAQKLAEKELAPTNRDGDNQGVTYENGVVRVPESFHNAYRLFCEGGWAALPIAQDHGGQGFPSSMYAASVELFGAANQAFMMYPGLTIGAARLLEIYGTEEQQRTYMDNMYAGEWCGTMCLTEPQAGSDVGALRTRAVKRPDGSYSISGNKIFISAGEHDLTDNIIHMVLARIDGAPAGTKGISIFIVPKKRIENGEFVDNDVFCMATEKKLGIHASSTCALNFGEKDNCIGYLLGGENQGMKIMFNMMNEARLAVGMQGLCQASASYMHALRYAKERFQGPEITTMKDPNAVKVPIIQHPDVRRMLMWMKSVTEGIRALLYYAHYCEDRMHIAKAPEEKDKYQGFLDILIPICKAWSSDMGFRVTELAVQTLGGYGYCREYPVEQCLRDAKITSIYEGTNGIQALDLVGRKLSVRQGALFKSIVTETGDLLKIAKKNYRLKDIVEPFDEARKQLIEVTRYFGLKSITEDFMTPILYATPYLELFGDVAVGFMLLWQAVIADRRLNELYEDAKADTPEKKADLLNANRSAAFYRGKVASAQFFANSILSLAKGKARAIMSGERSAIDLPEESFALF